MQLIAEHAQPNSDPTQHSAHSPSPNNRRNRPTRRTFNESSHPQLTEQILTALETHPPTRLTVQLSPQLSLQTILTDSLINPNGTPHVDVNSKRVMTTSGDNSAIARDMHRRMLGMVGKSSSRNGSPGRPSIYCTDVDNYPPITPHSLADGHHHPMATPQRSPPLLEEELQQWTPLEVSGDVEEEEDEHQQRVSRCDSPTTSTRKEKMLTSPSTPNLREYSPKVGGDSLSKPRPHTANASIARPLFPRTLSTSQLTHDHLNSGIAFAASSTPTGDPSDDRKRHQQKLQQLQAQQRQWAVRLGQTADRDYGLPADLFELDMCAATSKVSPETGIRFLKSMASKPSIYEGLRPRRRPQSAGKL